MNDIKIFVSHRIDIQSELIDNPLYYPVRCGAVFDNSPPLNDIAGDDTGDNISDKRMSFCEFTVQYWAWKNVDCEYYGLCHYRRFLSFSPKLYKSDCFVYRPSLEPSEEKRFGLLDSKRMEQVIRENDLLVNIPGEVEKIPTPVGFKKTVREMWEAHDNVFFDKASIDLMFSLIEKHSPEFLESANEYFDGHYHRGYNCYVMKKELFNRLCEFQFPILFELERQLDTYGYTRTMGRTVGYIGEMLYGIFIYHILKNENVRYKELQLIFFMNTDKITSKADLARRHAWFFFDRSLRTVADLILPIGTKRREVIKKALFKVLKIQGRGPAQIKQEKKD